MRCGSPFPGNSKVEGAGIQTAVEANPDGHEIEYTDFDPDPDQRRGAIRAKRWRR
jgi:hypothetical protein